MSGDGPECGRLEGRAGGRGPARALFPGSRGRLPHLPFFLQHLRKLWPLLFLFNVGDTNPEDPVLTPGEAAAPGCHPKSNGPFGLIHAGDDSDGLDLYPGFVCLGR